MQRISIPWIVEAINALDGLDDLLSGNTYSDYLSELMEAKYTLEKLFGLSIYRPYLRISLEKAEELYEPLIKIVDDEDFDLEKEMSQFSIWEIQNKKHDLKLVFISELSTIPVYLVTPKDSYDITILVEAGEKLFPNDILTKAPETASDIKEVGQCLAYERNTACGFHTFRVVESVLRRYWKEVTDENAKDPDPMTLGKIASELEQQKYGNEKVVESLKQLSKLHRNPIAHPEVILTKDEAIGAIGMARSVITHMLARLPEVPPTTG